MKNNLGNRDVMAQNIQYYMDINHKERRDVCRDLGISYTTLTDWIKGNTYPRIDKIELLAHYFNITKADLVEERSNKSAEKKIALVSDEQKLLFNYRKLNDTGKAKAQEDVEDLTQIPKYTADITLIQAAHQRTDVDMPEGIDASDDTYFD